MQSFLKLKALAADSWLCSQACKTAMLSGVFLMLSEQTNVISSTTGGVKLTLAHGPHTAWCVLPRPWPAVSNTLPVAQNWSPVKRATTVELVQFFSNNLFLSRFRILPVQVTGLSHTSETPESSPSSHYIIFLTDNLYLKTASYYYFSQLQTCFRFLYCCFYFNWMIYCLLPSRQLGYAPVPPWPWTG